LEDEAFNQVQTQITWCKMMDHSKASPRPASEQFRGRRRAAARKANSPPNDLSRFIEARANRALSDDAFARTVCSLPLFLAKVKLAATIVGRRSAHPGFPDDAAQQAILTYFVYLTQSRGAGFVGDTADDLGAWFYCGIREHLRWAIYDDRRTATRDIGRAQEYARRRTETAASRQSVHDRFGSLMSDVSALDEPLRTIAMDWVRGMSADESARKLGKSRRTIYRLRTQVCELLRSRLKQSL
jgi:hypothetical protein